jgi:hypothetical protein
MTNTSNTDSKPMEFTPQPLKQQPTTAPSYELNKDVTGKPPEKRGETFLTDKNGNQVRVPYPPVKSCRKCYGRGFVGYHAGERVAELKGRLIICTKCYPMVRR